MCTTQVVLGVPGEQPLVFMFCPHKGLFSATGVRRTPNKGAALAAKMVEARRLETPGQWGACAGVRRSPSQGAALALASKTTEAMRIDTVIQ